MKPIKKIILKDAVELSKEEMKNVLGGVLSNADTSSICEDEGRQCTLMVPDFLGNYVPYQGKCTTLSSGAWLRCACKAGDYTSNPDKPSNACGIA